MGSGRFDRHAYSLYATAATTRADGSAKTIHETFVNKDLKQSLNPYKANRESCDSAEHPLSNAIIIGLDITGSMGHIAHSMVKNGLGKLMNGIMETKPVTDPHIMFMAIGDAACDRIPLQVSQFESDIRIAQQLTDVVMEGGGGGNNTESYDLPWYFAADHTQLDCFNKRGKKGYLFTIGDEMPPTGLSGRQLEKIIGDVVQANLLPDALLAMAKERYEVFHLIIEQGDYARRRPGAVYDAWTKLMGNRAIRLSDYTRLSEIILATIRIVEGEDVDDVIAAFPECTKVLQRAFDLEMAQA